VVARATRLDQGSGRHQRRADGREAACHAISRERDSCIVYNPEYLQSFDADESRLIDLSAAAEFSPNGVRADRRDGYLIPKRAPLPDRLSGSLCDALIFASGSPIMISWVGEGVTAAPASGLT
jgi:hypothetical protein